MKFAPIVNQPCVECDRFMLRPLRVSDMGLIHLFTSDARLAHMVPNLPHPMPKGVAEALITRSISEERSEHVWAIDGTFHGGSELMGLISVQLLGALRGEVRFWIAPPLWNSGLAQAALSVFVDSNPLNIKALFAEVFQDNVAGARVMSRCGFTYLGDSERFAVARDTIVPTWTYSRSLD